MTALRIDRLQLANGGFRLRDVSLNIAEGQITTIVGPNGSGKSTLLGLIARLLKPDGGDIRIRERPVGAYRPAEFARTLTMLPQSKGAVPDLTVREIVSFGRAPHKRYWQRGLSDDDREAIELALEATGVKRYEDRLFAALSGGEQQKARIAMAMAQRTDILLLDEPTAYLDIAHQLETMEMIRRLNAERGLTVVMVLHELPLAAYYSDCLIAMKRGRVEAVGAPQAIVTPELMRTIYGIEAAIRFEDGYPVIVPVPFKPTDRGGNHP